MSFSDVLLTLAYYWALFLSTFVAYVLLFEESDRKKSQGLLYAAKKILGVPTINRYKKKLAERDEQKPNAELICGTDQFGNALLLKTTSTETSVVLYLNGRAYVGTFADSSLVARERVAFDGPLRRFADDEQQHVQFSFVWNGTHQVFRYPQDVPTSVLADVLAKEPWRNGDWVKLMEGSEEFGALRGHVQGHPLYLRGFRRRCRSDAGPTKFSVFATSDAGVSFNVEPQHGSLWDEKHVPVKRHDIVVADDELPKNLVFHLDGLGRRKYRCVITTLAKDAATHDGLCVVLCKGMVNGYEAYGLVCLSRGEITVRQLVQLGGAPEWTDDEVVHELDTPAMRRGEFVPIGELAPGALTPLAGSIAREFLNAYVYAPFGANLVGLYRNRLVLHGKHRRNACERTRVCFSTRKVLGPIETTLEELAEAGAVHARATAYSLARLRVIAAVGGDGTDSWLQLLPASANFKLLHQLRVIDRDDFLAAYAARGIVQYELDCATWGSHPELVDEHQQFHLPQEKLRAKPRPSCLVRLVAARFKESLRRRVRADDDVQTTYDILRVQFAELSERLVRERRLADATLLYHFTLDELRDFVAGTGGPPLWKLERRRTLHKKTRVARTIAGTFLGTIEDVTGRACVVTDVLQLNCLRFGDVLITTNVNVNWMPYLTSVAALVLESSGDFSYGAVVVKHHTFPVLEGARGATEAFVTGDMVTISKKHGVVSKVQYALKVL